MQKENQAYFQEENSWFNCIGDIEPNPISGTHSKTQTDILHFQNGNSSTAYHIPSPLLSCTQKNINQTRKSMKRDRQNLEAEEQYYTENSSSYENKSKLSDSKEEGENKEKGNYTDKQHIYSKNYRQRKKQQVKSLEEENQFLRKKMQDLEFRLREMQLQINRLKFMPQEKQYTIEQLNHQFMQKVTVIMEKNKQNPAQFKSKYDSSDPFYGQFMDTYSKHGFGGSKKMQIMNYYYNEIMEAMLRDSERYFCLMCLYAKSGEQIQAFPQYEAINATFFDILQPDEDKMKRLKYFQVNLHPMILNLVSDFKEFNAKYNNIVQSIGVIHEFMKSNYPANFDFARMRIVQLQAYFEKHKYTKMMRNLRSQWMEEIKKDLSSELHGKKKVSGTKKKKVAHKDQ